MFKTFALFLLMLVSMGIVFFVMTIFNGILNVVHSIGVKIYNEVANQSVYGNASDNDILASPYISASLSIGSVIIIIGIILAFVAIFMHAKRA